MKYIKQSIIKRVFALLLCTILFSFTVFMSYGNTLIVKADDIGYDVLLRDATNIALATLGIYVTAQSGGSLAPVMIPYISAIAGAGFDVHDYVTDNGDGTTTVSEDFVQLVLQSYNQYKEENAEKFDGTMVSGEDGYYYFPEISFTCFYSPGNTSFNQTERCTDIYTYYPCAVYFMDLRGFIVFYNSGSDEFYCLEEIYSGNGSRDPDIICPATETFLCPKECTSAIIGVGVYQRYFTRVHVGVYDSNPPAGSSLTADSQYIPVYRDISALKQGLRTGDFSAAYNYGKVSGLESSKYTGSYSGGDIIVANEKLEGISDKLAEIDETGKSIDDKLKDLLDWLGIGGGSSGTGGSSAPSGWYESVLAYLDSILSALEALVWIEADDTINADKKDLFDLIDRIWEDPENGSQEAADTISGSFLDVAKGITKKFPFSIPWDIHALFTVFANAGSPEPAAMAYSAGPAAHYSDSGGIQAYTTDPEGLAQDAHDAPYFVLPLVIESYGINENVVVDLKDFQTVSTLSRSLLAVLFAVFLIKFTVSLMEMFKGGADG